MRTSTAPQLKPMARRDPVRAKEATEEDTLIMMMMMTMIALIMMMMTSNDPDENYHDDCEDEDDYAGDAQDLQLMDQWDRIGPQPPEGKKLKLKSQTKISK